MATNSFDPLDPDGARAAPPGPWERYQQMGLKPFTGTLDGQKPADGPLTRGWNKSKQSMGITAGLAQGDAAGTARKVAQADVYARANPSTPEADELRQAWERGEGVTGGVSEVFGEVAKDWREAPTVIGGLRSLARNARAMGEGVLEQTPNMLAPMGGMIAGGAAGSMAGPIGMFAGAWAGSTAGNTAVEGGAKVLEAINKAGIDPQNGPAVEAYLREHGDRLLGEAATKGAIIGAVDTATMGASSMLLKAPAKAAAGRALAGMGVNAADKAAVKAAMQTPEFAARIGSDAAYHSASTGAQNLARHVGAAALEPAGEFAGEYLGEGVASGQWDAKNATLEALSSLGQSGVTFAGQKAWQVATTPAGTKAKGPPDTSAAQDAPGADPHAQAPSFENPGVGFDPDAGQPVVYPDGSMSLGSEAAAQRRAQQAQDPRPEPPPVQTPEPAGPLTDFGGRLVLQPMGDAGLLGNANGQPFVDKVQAGMAIAHAGGGFAPVAVEGGFALQPTEGGRDWAQINIERGQQAMGKALAQQTTVHRAMQRPGLGWVDFEWGDVGRVKPSGKTEGAMGLAHILEARARKDGLTQAQAGQLLDAVVQTVANGQEMRRTTVGNRTNVQVQDGNYRVALLKAKGSNAWVVTGFELSQAREQTGIDFASPTQSDPTLSRGSLGAGSLAPDAATATHQDTSDSGSPVGAGSLSNIAQPAHFVKPSQALGLDPASGPLSAAAAQAVDSGAARLARAAAQPAPSAAVFEAGLARDNGPATGATSAPVSLLDGGKLALRPSPDGLMRNARGLPFDKTQANIAVLQHGKRFAPVEIEGGYALRPLDAPTPERALVPQGQQYDGLRHELPAGAGADAGLAAVAAGATPGVAAVAGQPAAASLDHDRAAAIAAGTATDVPGAGAARQPDAAVEPQEPVAAARPAPFASYAQADAYRRQQVRRGSSVHLLPAPAQGGGFHLVGKEHAQYAQAQQLYADWQAKRGQQAQAQPQAPQVIDAANPDIRYSRAPATQQAYEARIDALFAGAAASRKGAVMLDRSDVMGLLGHANVPLVLNEAHIAHEGRTNHPEMTAAVWKKVPGWLENPAAVYTDPAHKGRLTVIGPELLAGYPVVMAVEPNPAVIPQGHTQPVQLLVTAFAKTTGNLPAFGYLKASSRLLYADTKMAPVAWPDIGDNPRAFQPATGAKRILTEKNLAGWRKANTAAYSFAGQQADTANRHALEVARQRIESGQDAEVVRQDTGWHQGVDGRWRFEINDQDAHLLLSKQEFVSFAQGGDAVRLADLLHHPALFAAYPQLADMPVGLKDGKGATYYTDGRIALGRDMPQAQMRSILMHEIQHGIQHVEGFAMGGRASQYKGNPAQQRDQYRRAAGEVEARNTQARLDMSDQARRAFAPQHTQDVDDGQVLVSFNGKDAPGAPMPANAQEVDDGLTPQLARRTAALQQAVGAIHARWTNAPETVVVANMRDSRVPQALREHDAAQRSRGATGEPEGFFYQGKVYLVASQVHTAQDAARVLAHEALGHYGLRGVFGPQLVPILNRVALARRAQVIAKARQYGLVGQGVDQSSSDSEVWQSMTPEQRQQAAEEVLAVLAQTQPQSSFVRDAVAAIRAWLREHVPGFEGLRLTDEEIIREYILPARGWVQRGSKPRSAAEMVKAALQRKQQSELLELAKLARQPGNENKTVDLGAVSDKQAALLAREGVAVTGEYRHAADMFAVRHALNRHGDAKVEQSRAQIAITDDDVATIAQAVSEPDALVLGAKTPRGQDVIGSIKRLPDGTLLYIEEVRTGRKTLAMTSMRKYPGTSDFEAIANSLLPTNARSDTGDVRIVHPDDKSGQAGATLSLLDRAVDPQRQASNFIQARMAAKAFQGQPLTNEATGMVAVVSRNSLDKMLSTSAVEKSESPASHALAVANVDELFNKALLGWSKPDRDGSVNIPKIHRFFAPIMSAGKAQLVKITVKETARSDQPNPLYTVEAVEFNEKSPAVKWVDSTVQADGLDPTSDPPGRGVHSLAQQVEDFNRAASEPPPMFSRASDSAARLGQAIKSATVQGMRQRAGYKMTDWLGLGLQTLGRRQLVDIYAREFGGVQGPMQAVRTIALHV